MLHHVKALLQTPRTPPCSPWLMQAVQLNHRLGWAPSLTSKSHASCQTTRHTNVSCAARSKAQLAETAANFDSFPTGLEAAAAEMALQAASGSSWPAETRTVIEAAHKAMGGRFLLVVCGHWADPHPQAGHPAYARFQMVFVSVSDKDDEATLYKVHRKPVQIQVGARLGTASTDCFKKWECNSSQ